MSQGASVDFVCPFCGGRVFADSKMKHPDGGEGGVLHTMPPCKMFMTNEVTEFLAACRKKLEGAQA